jgi:hypothetical protein
MCKNPKYHNPKGYCTCDMIAAKNCYVCKFERYDDDEDLHICALDPDYIGLDGYCDCNVVAQGGEKSCIFV